jgi:hypothetical protein
MDDFERGIVDFDQGIVDFERGMDDFGRGMDEAERGIDDVGQARFVPQRTRNTGSTAGRESSCGAAPTVNGVRPHSDFRDTF